MDCSVVYEGERVVQVKYNDILYSIQKGTGILCELMNTGPSTDIVIPHILPSGHRIQYLASDKSDEQVIVGPMVMGEFGEIKVSDGIFIGCCAFEYANVKTVIWNDCSCIPADCFHRSRIEKISNITSVKTIMEGAFSHCNIREMTWPEQCKSIPAGCFEFCERLGKLDNIEHIEFIGANAFFETKLSVLDLSDTSISYLVPRSLHGLPESCEITLPYYVCNGDLAKALWQTSAER